jgi:hypothetical protein
MKKTLTIIGLAVATLTGAQAQVLFNNFTAKTQDFNTFAGTSITVPANWAYSGTDYTPGGFYNRASAYSNTNSTYGLRNDSSSSDISFGSKMGASEGPFTLTMAGQNTTGSVLSGFTVLWDVEQYSAAFRATTVNFSYRVGAGSFVTTGITGTTLTTASLGATDGANLASIAVTGRSITISGLSVADLTTVDFRWTWTTGAGSGNNAHIGIDNVSVTAVPEPTTWTLIGIGSAFMLWNVRRRRSVQA